jgi:hypothetical protein
MVCSHSHTAKVAEIDLGKEWLFSSPFCDHLRTGLVGCLFLHIDYPNYDHHPFDPGKLVPTIFGTAVVVST